MRLSVAIITYNEEANIARTLESVKWADEIVIIDSGSTDRTRAIAESFGAKVFTEQWKGFAEQKNSALDKCSGDWILVLDADEQVTEQLAASIGDLQAKESADAGTGDNARCVRRRNLFLGRWIRHGGFYPDGKLRLIRRGFGRFGPRKVHEDLTLLEESPGRAPLLNGDLIHHAYPTLTSYIEHMNRYSTLGAEMVREKKTSVGFSVTNIVLRPLATFFYNYFLRLGFLDGKEGLLLHLYHSTYVSWKYAKAWDLSKKSGRGVET
jgi:glycosyltransferase involved in cell wall biosynthesis